MKEQSPTNGLGGRLSRRRLLRTLGAGALMAPFFASTTHLFAQAIEKSASAGGAASSSAAGPSQGPILRTIPSSGLKVPAVGLGTARTYSLAGLSLAEEAGTVAELDVAPETLARLREVLQRFYEEGGRLVDSSPMYGTAEELVGRFARDLEITDELILATKVWTDGQAMGARQMEASIERLGREPLDIMLIHNLRDWRTHYRTLRTWKEQGRLRHIGISHSQTSAHDEVARVLKSEPFDVLQINYNVLDRNADQRLLPLAQEQRLGVLINEPFGSGELFALARDRELPAWAREFDANSWAQLFLKFVIAHPAVTCALPATSKPKHVVDNTRAMYGRLPGEAERRKIVALLTELQR